ncbi:hypothetical protein LSAT2_026077 [Lamellibrachia satsuma]|nr:hypothetical protein LSAT2_026077 [Lamellibrachia satsuma]
MSRTLPPKTVNLRTSKESELHNVVLVYFVSPVISDDDSETDLDSQTRSESESDSISESGSEQRSSTKRPRMESRCEADETNKQARMRRPRMIVYAVLLVAAKTFGWKRSRLIRSQNYIVDALLPTTQKRRSEDPFTDFTWLCDLDEKKGLDIGTTYRNDKQAQSFAHFIAQQSRDEMSERLRSTPFLSIISDGTQDHAFMEQEIIFLRSARAGKVLVDFISVENVEKADATGIHNALHASMTSVGLEKEMWTKKLVGFGSDGAPVMTGKNRGVIAKLKNDQPLVQGIHCHAHRLVLAFKDTLKKQPLHDKVSSLLLGLYYFYQKSSLNRSMLKRAFNALGMKPIMPTRVGGTRWVSHTLRALENLWKAYPAIVTHLQQLPTQANASAEAVGKSRGYLKLLLNQDVMMYAHFETDVISILTKLSVFMQREKCIVSDIMMKVHTTTEVLRKYKTWDGAVLRKFMPGTTLHDHDLTTAAKPAFHSARVSTIDKLSDCLQRRFDDAQTNILEATQMANFTLWPETNVEGFGDEHVVTLVTHFSSIMEEAGFCPSEVEQEWDMLKAVIYRSCKDVAELTWEGVNRRHLADHQNILALVDIILSLPAHSADAERGFSEMKLVKTDWRSKLGNDILTDLLHISFHTASIADFDPTAAIHLWNSSGTRARRPEFVEFENSKDTDSDMSEDAFSDVAEL